MQMPNEIHPTAIIGDGVVLGEGNRIGPFVTIVGPVTIGHENWFGAGVVIGAPPEVRGLALSTGSERADRDDESPGVRIGDRNVFREYAQIHQGMRETTQIGDDCYVMNQVYVAHDGRIGDRVTLASSVLLAGHVAVGEGANLGMGTCVHQFRSIGAGAMVGMGSVVTHDVPAFAKAYGSPARVHGANRVGLQRMGVPDADIDAIETALRDGEGPTLTGAVPPTVLRLLGVLDN